MFDSSVVRELLGKKLTTRQRNSLDDVSEKTRVPLRSCRRQVLDIADSYMLYYEIFSVLRLNHNEILS